jgi:hypothetical protein
MSETLDRMRIDRLKDRLAIAIKLWHPKPGEPLSDDEGFRRIKKQVAEIETLTRTLGSKYR